MNLKAHFSFATWLSDDEKKQALALFRDFRRDLLQRGVEDTPFLKVRLADLIRQWILLQRVEASALQQLAQPVNTSSKIAANAHLALLEHVNAVHESLHAEFDALTAPAEAPEVEKPAAKTPNAAPAELTQSELEEQNRQWIRETNEMMAHMESVTGLNPTDHGMPELIEWAVRQELRGEYFPVWCPDIRLPRDVDLARGRGGNPEEYPHFEAPDVDWAALDRLKYGTNPANDYTG